LVNTGTSISVIKKFLISTFLSDVSLTAKMFISDSKGGPLFFLELVGVQMGGALMGVKLFAVNGLESEIVLDVAFIKKHVNKLDLYSRKIEWDTNMIHRLCGVGDVLWEEGRLVKGLT
jgi:hypothetical protein